MTQAVGPGVLNQMLNASVRMPVIFAGMNATLLSGEVAMRVIGQGLSYVGFTGETRIASAVSAKIPDVTVNLMRPFKTLTEKQLGVSLIASAVIASIGWEICNKLLDKAPETYNTFASWTGPVQLNTGWRHPAIAAVVTWWNKK